MPVLLLLVREDVSIDEDATTKSKALLKIFIMSISYKLDPQFIQTLFEDVEKSGVSINKFNLLELCNKKTYLYGEVGSAKRRAIQKIFAEAKRKTSRQCIKFLEKHNVQPGESLKADFLESAPVKESKESEPVKESKEESEAEYTPSDNEYESGTESTINSSAPSVTTKQRSMKVSTPVQDIQFQNQTKRMQSDCETYPNTNSIYSGAGSINTLQTVAILEMPERKQDGTKERPYIIIADPERPESCNGFEVALIPNITVGNYVRSVYHIRHVTTQGMESDWSATIPHEEFPTLANRAVLIRGPSQELWHRRPDLYHEEKFCAQTAIIHEAQQTAIKQSIVRLYSYWLLILPRGTILENYIISHDSINVTTGTQEMTKAFEAEDESGKPQLETLYGMDVFWRIAIAGGSMVTDPGSAAKKRRKKKTATVV